LIGEVEDGEGVIEDGFDLQPEGVESWGEVGMEELGLNGDGFWEGMDGEAASFKEKEFVLLKKGERIGIQKEKDGGGGFFGHGLGFDSPEDHSISPREIKRCEGSIFLNG